MNWNQNQNQGRTRDNVNVNTQLYTLTCALFHDRLTVKAWNRNLSISIAPAVSQTPEGVVEYALDRKDCVNTTISAEKAIVLDEMYEKTLAPAIAAGTPKSISVVIKSVAPNNGYQSPAQYKVITLGYDGTNEYLRVAYNVDESGVGSPSNCITHVFAKKEGYEDYDLSTGNRVTYTVEADFDRFIQSIKNVKYFGPEIAHGIKLNNAYKSSNETPSSWNNGASSGYQNNYQNDNSGFNQYGMNTPSYGRSTIADMTDTLPFN